MRICILFCISLLVLSPDWSAGSQGPKLPAGLSGPSQENATQSGPDLPSGLQPVPEKETGGKEQAKKSLEKEAKSQVSWREKLPFSLSGYLDVRGGVRIVEDPRQKDESLAEARLQLEGEKYWGTSSLEVTADFLYDPVLNEHRIDLEEGEGVVDLRQARFSFTPFSFMDVKLGRQVLTWGTGNFIFINDLFPKDFRSFFIGRDIEYLKAPSDALKASIYTQIANLDLVYTPRFDSDRFIDGRRLSFFNPLLGRVAGRENQIEVKKPDDWFQDDEIAIRIFKNISGYKLAAYAYQGFWKNPAGIDPVAAKATFPELNVYGVSGQGTLGPGIANLELGYYDSRQDSDGDDPFIRNSELRFLLGYNLEVAKDFMLGLQYYLEHMLDYSDYEQNLPPGQPKSDEYRHTITLDLTKQLLMQTLELSLFTFYSPSDGDAHFRPRAKYDLTDQWTLSIGANIFVGKDEHTFFGQLEDNSNAFAGLRYSF